MSGPKHTTPEWKAKWDSKTIVLEFPKTPKPEAQDYRFELRFDLQGNSMKVFKPDNTEATEIDGHNAGGGHICPRGQCHLVIGGKHYCVTC
jgi:hypothetical protein